MITRRVGELELVTFQEVASLTTLEANNIREMAQSRGDGLPYYQEYPGGPLYYELSLVMQLVDAAAAAEKQGLHRPDHRDEQRSAGANKDSKFLRFVRLYLRGKVWTPELLQLRVMTRKGTRNQKHYGPLPWPAPAEVTLFDAPADSQARSLSDADRADIREMYEEALENFRVSLSKQIDESVRHTIRELYTRDRHVQ